MCVNVFSSGEKGENPLNFNELKNRICSLSRPNQIAAGLLIVCLLSVGIFCLASRPGKDPEEIAALRSYTVTENGENSILIKKNLYAKTNPSLNAPLDYRIPAYTRCVVEGQTKEGLTILRIADSKIYVQPELLANQTEKGKDRLVNSNAIGRETPSLSNDKDKNLSKSDEEWLKEKEEYIKNSVGETMQDTGWGGPNINSIDGTVDGPSGKETYYNLPMEGVVKIMTDLGFPGEYWVREDGVKMLGDFVMIATNLDVRPRGSLVPTSMGMGLVCDTGTFAETNPYQIDIAVDWK